MRELTSGRAHRGPTVAQAVAATAAVASMAGLTVAAQPAREGPPADGTAVWSHITDAAPYKVWPLWPGTAERRPSTASGAHGARVSIYANDVAIRAIEEQSDALPDGAMVVLESHDADKALIGVAVMYVVQGYDKDAGDIFWLRATDGVIRAEGRVQGCIECHAGAGNGDFVFSPGLEG